MGISARWLKSLVGLRKVERKQQQRHRKEDEDAGQMVRLRPIILRFWRILVLKLVVGALMLFIAWRPDGIVEGLY
jgi:hypothetical protein